MKEIIKFNLNRFNRILFIGLIISLAIFIAFFLFWDIDSSFIYLISMFFLFIVVLLSYFLNRFEPENIIIEVDTITISYINKAFFKKNQIKTKIRSLEIKSFERVIILKNNGLLIANIRKCSLKANDWELITNILVEN